MPQWKSLFLILPVTYMVSIAGCGITKSRFIQYAPQQGTTDVCPNAQQAYDTVLVDVFTAENCNCHGSGTAPAVTGNSSIDSNAFYVAARERGSAIKLVNYLQGGHAGSNAATAQAAGLQDWAEACTSGSGGGGSTASDTGSTDDDTGAAGDEGTAEDEAAAQ